MTIVRLAWWLTFIGIVIAIGLVMLGSRVEAQESIKIDIKCREGMCQVPEKYLMLILKARDCAGART